MQGTLMLRRARDTDAPAALALLQSEGLEAAFDPAEFDVALADGKLVACARLKTLDDGTRELASVAVARESRGMGLGRKLVERTLARADGAVYALALAPGFFEKLGFARIDSLPSALREKAEGACASTGFVPMRREDAQSVADQVRARYGAIATEGGSCCGTGASCCAADKLTLGTGDPVSAADLRPGDVVVDLGSGAGGDVLAAAAKVGATGRAIGIDFTPEMIERARSSARGVAHAEFHFAPIERVPLPDAVADVVVSNCVVNLSDDKPAVLREALRVLRPGGRLVVSDTMREEGKTPGGITCDCVGGALTESEWRAALADAGFVDVSVEDEGPYAEGVRRGLVRARRRDQGHPSEPRASSGAWSDAAGVAPGRWAFPPPS